MNTSVKVQKGQEFFIDNQSVTITKVSSMPCGIIKRTQERITTTPVFRVYYKRHNNSKGHVDVVQTDDLEIVCG